MPHCANCLSLVVSDDIILESDGEGGVCAVQAGLPTFCHDWKGEDTTQGRHATPVLEEAGGFKITTALHTVFKNLMPRVRNPCYL